MVIIAEYDSGDSCLPIAWQLMMDMLMVHVQDMLMLKALSRIVCKVGLQWPDHKAGAVV